MWLSPLWREKKWLQELQTPRFRPTRPRPKAAGHGRGGAEGAGTERGPHIEAGDPAWKFHGEWTGRRSDMRSYGTWDMVNKNGIEWEM